MTKRFDGVKVVVGLIQYGLSAEFYEWHNDKVSDAISLYLCRDYASDRTGELVYMLLQQIASKNWNDCIKTIEKIKKSEGAK